MKKSILVIVTMVALISGAADTDSYLYWMVNVDESSYSYNYTAKVRDTSVTTPGDEYLDLYYVGAESTFGKGVSEDIIRAYEKDAPGWGFYAKLAASPTYGSYVIELWSGSDLVGQSSALEYSEALAQGYIAQSGIGMPAAAPWTVQMTLPVPEPNSGLLLLIGSAVLALRRRKQGKKA